MNGEFIPLPHNMKFDIINTSYFGNKASQRGQTSKAFPMAAHRGHAAILKVAAIFNNCLQIYKLLQVEIFF